MSRYSDVVVAIVVISEVFVLKGTYGSTCSLLYNDTQSGFRCKYCPPGTYLHEACSYELGDSVCKPCPLGYYEQNCNIAHSCEPCDDCKSRYMVGGVVLTPCNATRPTECVCPAGKYYQNESAQHGVCLPYSTCVPPKWVRKDGTPWSDRLCGVCPTGTFYVKEPHFGESQDPCRPESTTPKSTVSGKTDNASNGLKIGLGVGILLGAFAIAIAVAISACYRRQRCCFRGTENANTKLDVESNATTNGPVNINYIELDEHQGKVTDSNNSRRNGSAVIEETANGAVSCNGMVRERPSHEETDASESEPDMDSADSDNPRISQGDGRTSTGKAAEHFQTDSSKSKPTGSATTEAKQNQNAKCGLSKESVVFGCDGVKYGASCEGKSNNQQICHYLAMKMKKTDIIQMLRHVEDVNQEALELIKDNVEQDCKSDNNSEKKYQLLYKYSCANPDKLFETLCQSLQECDFNDIKKAFYEKFSGLNSSENGVHRDTGHAPGFTGKSSTPGGQVNDNRERQGRSQSGNLIACDTDAVINNNGNFNDKTNDQANEAGTGPNSKSVDKKSTNIGHGEPSTTGGLENDNRESPGLSQSGNLIACDTDAVINNNGNFNDRTNDQANKAGIGLDSKSVDKKSTNIGHGEPSTTGGLEKNDNRESPGRSQSGQLIACDTDAVINNSANFIDRTNCQPKGAGIGPDLKPVNKKSTNIGHREPSTSCSLENDNRRRPILSQSGNPLTTDTKAVFREIGASNGRDNGQVSDTRNGPVAEQQSTDIVQGDIANVHSQALDHND